MTYIYNILTFSLDIKGFVTKLQKKSWDEKYFLITSLLSYMTLKICIDLQYSQNLDFVKMSLI